ncbi:MAG TPA: prolyl oligopeptidase family serine peptidase [Mucilaginibacter sp.]|nr:prolyl oligopeptidase family serine peptidase [Mucilaginibacter sp.]
MKKLLLIPMLLSTVITSAQQLSRKSHKPPVDFEAMENWPHIGDVAISNDGQYAYYYIENRPVGKKTFVIASTKSSWKREIIGAADAAFSEDSRKVIFKTSDDSLSIITLGSKKIDYRPSVKSFKLIANGRSGYLLYQQGNVRDGLVLQDIQKGKSRSYENVESYQVSQARNVLLLLSKKDQDEKQTLRWVQLPEGEIKEIWKGTGADNFVFDNSGIQMAFVVEKDGDGKKDQTFWYYHNGDNKASLLIDNHAEGIESGFSLNGIDRFSSDGTNLFFKVQEPDFSKPKQDAISVDVWSYQDAKLQSQQLKALTQDSWGDGGPQSYTCLIRLADRKIIRLQRESEALTLFDGRMDETGFLTRSVGNRDYWGIQGKPDYAIISTASGERKTIRMDCADWSSLGMSPDGKYILLRQANQDIFSYELATSITRPLTKALPIPLIDENYDWVNPVRGINVAGWTEANKCLLYDSYDIWQLDPAGKDQAVCLTNGYGRKHELTFRLPGSTSYRDQMIPDKGTLILSVFNKRNKDNGFYSIDMTGRGNPEELTMGPYAYYHPTVDAGFPMQPIKAKNADVWLVERESASESPNLFVTSDFKNLKQVSSIYPEKHYNWFTTKLINYQTLDGKPSQGILYLPDNLDTTKKNPLIIYYYEKMSQHLNDYKRPEFSPGWMEIPYFVSQGYVVFTPDINFKIGQHAESTTNSILGAAKYLKQLPWIDSTKLGIQGHSMGGFETNTIITQSNIFAAACSASGSSDLISHVNEITAYGSATALQNFVERGQYRMGSTLWQRPDLYIRNSPIFNLHKVTTPVLIMHNKEDGAVPFEQGVELFTALRRLGKRAWMLQYDGKTHSVSGDASKDYTIRMKQFFDHYLKDEPAPRWMLYGIPAKDKGIDDGLELVRKKDAEGHWLTPPKGGLLTPEERVKVDSLMHRKPVTVTIN